jgi:hypothetical protein
MNFHENNRKHNDSGRYSPSDKIFHYTVWNKTQLCYFVAVARFSNSLYILLYNPYPVYVYEKPKIYIFRLSAVVCVTVGVGSG